MSLSLRKIRKNLVDRKLDSVIITNPDNRRYITGFTGSAGIVVITREKSALITDFRYVEQASSQAVGFEIIKQSGSPFFMAKEYLSGTDVKTVGFEADYLTFSQHKKLSESLEGLDLVPVENLVESVRMVKFEDEVENIKRVEALGDRAFSHILKYIKPGVKEIELALEVEYFMRREGASKMGFETIVASGERSSMPHGVASNKELRAGELITFDFGGVMDGYCGDMTRTVVLGKADKKQKEIYDIVLKAQLAGLEAIKSGVKCSEADAVSRKIITDYGYGDNFGHGLGHGLGLAVHEAPSLSPSDSSVLESGMVVTCEPGIYIEGWGGVRIEDLVLVTDKGNIIFSRSTKDLIEI